MNLQKLKSIAFSASALVLATVGVFAVCASGADTPTESPSVVIKSAKVVSSEYISGDCTVSVDGNTASVNLGTFTQPGAYAQIEAEIVNNGGAAAILTGVRELSPEAEGIEVDYPDLEVGTEKLLSGDVCTISITVSCSADYESDTLDIQNAEFEFELLYTADEPATTEPATTEPATTEPATTEPATTVPATTEPATTEPATTEPVTTEPATTEPAATEPATTEPATTEPATTEPATTEPATTEPATTEPATTEPATTEPATTEPATTEPAATEPAATEPTTAVQPTTASQSGTANEVKKDSSSTSPKTGNGSQAAAAAAVTALAVCLWACAEIKRKNRG